MSIHWLLLLLLLPLLPLLLLLTPHLTTDRRLLL
jgi:hypothetical protein